VLRVYDVVVGKGWYLEVEHHTSYREGILLSYTGRTQCYTAHSAYICNETFSFMLSLWQCPLEIGSDSAERMG